ncbi:atrophin-1 isoform X2 [Cephus cinctus]|uniref:Atrophin-1 isoform X2 n=1 Tax=Cephus cinctus TaxID=211228 RepID=A0AAJ7R7E5_CEPCN|nr:atrophin-1 isoform X2 [Cephus cinctus]XP_024935653.1 atrophin-1 isoform X2 [Cephus cinctus]
MSSASTGGTEGSSPASSPASAASLAMAAPKYGTLVPNRIFVGGISASTSEAELAQLFSAYGNVKATKIISDRAGVSKGYGFVTFETEEEAKRLQQESECIVLRERKLNIAPAIKKQPFNRSFDGGSGSPPAVPSNAYYYTNGMGLTYQSGMTFYNTGAPAPGTPIAPSADPATIYQAAGVFGPQPATGHQTFAPVMYPCPAPSLYMPQQYQYTPMPYDSYYAGAAAAGAPQYLYTTSSGPQSNIGSGSGGGGSGGGGGGGQGVPGIGGSNGTSSNNSGNTNINGSNSATGATSTPTVSHQQQPSSATTSGLSSVASLGPPPPPSANHHFYSTGGPPPPGLHHPPLVTCPPAPTQIEQHLYYSFPTAGPPGPPPPPSSAHATLGLPDQQLLLYATDASTVATCQQTSADAQTSNQEDCRSTSSHSDQPHSETQAVQPSGSATPLVSLMPFKFPVSARYTNYHPIAIHTANLHGSQSSLNNAEECNSNQMHCRTILYHHPAAVYIPHTHGPQQPPPPPPPPPPPQPPSFHDGSTGGSLLPTPPPHHYNQPTSFESSFKMQNVTHKDYSKVVGTQNAYAKSPNLNIALISGAYHHTGGYGKGPQRYAASVDHAMMGHKYQSGGNAFNSPRVSHGPAHQYCKRSANLGSPSPSGFYTSQKSIATLAHSSAQAFQKSSSYNVPPYVNGHFYTCNSGPQRTTNESRHFDNANGRRNIYVSSENANESSNGKSAVQRNSYRNNTGSNSTKSASSSQGSDTLSQSNESQPETVTANEHPVSPPPAPYSPMTRLLPTLSPPNPQVQFYAPAQQNRYQPPPPPPQHQHHHQHQAQHHHHQPPSHHQHPYQHQQQQRRYAMATSILPTGRNKTSSSDKYTSTGSTGQTGASMLRQQQQNKYKVNGGLVQNNPGNSGTGGKVSDDSLGGAGDASSNSVGRLPITPPATPRGHHANHSSHPAAGDQNQLTDACHQMQALTL